MQRYAACVLALSLLVSDLARGGDPDIHLDLESGHEYLAVPNSGCSVTVYEARFVAELAGGYLAAITSEAEHEGLVDAFGSSRFWIGLSDEIEEGVFRWDSGEPFDYAPETFDGDSGDEEDDRDHVTFRNAHWGTSEGWIGYRALIESSQPFLPGPDSLTLSLVDGVTATWSAVPEATSIEFYRGFGLIAVLPGDATSYQDPDGYCGALYTVLPRFGEAPGRPRCRRTCVGIPDGFHLWTPSTTSTANPAFVPVLAANEERMSGHSFGICFDTSVASITVHPGLNLAWTGQGPAFYSTQSDSSGVSVGTVYGFLEPVLPPALCHEIHVLECELLGTDVGSFTASFCDEVGTPAVSTVFVVLGESLVPTQSFGPVEFIDVRFVRGDANRDDSVDIADALALTGELFGPEREVFCFEAADTNDDAQFDVADVVYLLSHLFFGGAPPAAPYPECGADPDGLQLGCELTCP